MNYLENMGENLELLDLVKKCNVTTYSLRSIRDKNTAIKNLKGLRVELLRVSPSYMRENPCELVKTEVSVIFPFMGKTPERRWNRSTRV